jgi:hypothetical protein
MRSLAKRRRNYLLVGFEVLGSARLRKAGDPRLCHFVQGLDSRDVFFIGMSGLPVSGAVDVLAESKVIVRQFLAFLNEVLVVSFFPLPNFKSSPCVPIRPRQVVFRSVNGFLKLFDLETPLVYFQSQGFYKLRRRQVVVLAELRSVVNTYGSFLRFPVVWYFGNFCGAFPLSRTF